MQRNTSQRRAIRKAFQDTARPLSTGEVLERARGHVPGLGIATVYRTVKGLAEQGEVVPVELPGEPVRYELSGKAHHHHFQCRRCNRVFDLVGCPEGLERLLPAGFTLENHEVVLYGLCAECGGDGR